VFFSRPDGILAGRSLSKLGVGALGVDDIGGAVATGLAPLILKGL
jgi:hypothetical protein